MLAGEYSMTENTLQITTKIIDGIHSTNTFLFSYEISKNELTLTAEMTVLVLSWKNRISNYILEFLSK